MSDSLTRKTVVEFLDALASSAPAPGGGSVAALSGSLGAALVSMVCNLTLGKKKYADVQDDVVALVEQSETLRGELADLIEADVAAFTGVSAAYRMPRTTSEEQAARSTAIQDALKAATVVPMQVALACVRVLDLCTPAAEKGNVNAVSDAGVAALMAEAGLRSAALNVIINLNAIKDSDFCQDKGAELDALLDGKPALKDQIYDLVVEKLGGETSGAKTGEILDGRAVAGALRARLDQDVQDFKERTGVTPTIALVRAGEDPASVSYAGTIERGFIKRGMGFVSRILAETATQEEIVAAVSELNGQAGVHGIMIQEPLPKGIDPAAVKAALSPEKDVDGVHPLNSGRLAQVAPAGRPPGVGNYFVPATPAGGLEILKHYHIPLAGKHAVVVGRSSIVGKPMAMLLLRENATVTMCHSRTADLAAVCRQADVLCVAVGRAKMIKGDWIRPGATVIDFGVNFGDGKMCGDVDYEQAVQVAGKITPVPGGTGPVTNVMLMRNVLEAATNQVG